jgi:hypothetical protein
MSDIMADAVPTVAAIRVHANTLRVACPHCRTRHYHGASGAGPHHGHRLAHCVDADLPPALQNRLRNGVLGYHLVEVQQPRRIAGPPLVPRNGHPVGELLACNGEIITVS